MMNKSFKINKYISIGEDSFELTIESKPNVLGSEKLIIDIIRVNDDEVRYTIETIAYTHKKDRYFSAISDVLQKFKDDKELNELLGWDGKLKYKISL